MAPGRRPRNGGDACGVRHSGSWGGAPHVGRDAAEGRDTALTGRPVLLALRALGLGDFLTAVPALRALHRARADHEVVLAAPRAVAPLAELSGAVDRIHHTPDLDAFVAPAEPVDIAVNLHGKGPQSHDALRTVASREFLAFALSSPGYAGPRWRADEHEVHRWCRLVAEGWAVDADPTDLRLDRPAADPPARGAVVVHPGAAYPARRWPMERFAEVASWAHRRGLRVVVTGSAGELALARAVARVARLPQGSVLAGRTALDELAALVADARLVVAGDTGVAHLASAYGTPSVVLFGPTPPDLWGPPPDGPHVALWHGTAPGDPWALQVDVALLRIGTDEVIAHAARLLGRTTSIRRRGESRAGAGP